jgi:hypothetical protein
MASVLGLEEHSNVGLFKDDNENPTCSFLEMGLE